MIDLEYICNGLFVSFMPVSEAGKVAWEQMEAQRSSKVLCIHADAVKAQLRQAGYTVRKARKVTTSADDLLLALFE